VVILRLFVFIYFVIHPLGRAGSFFRRSRAGKARDFIIMFLKSTAGSNYNEWRRGAVYVSKLKMLIKGRRPFMWLSQKHYNKISRLSGARTCG
jgi:hypothetical protein